MTITAEQEMKRLFSELKELCGRERQGVLILVRSDGSGFMQLYKTPAAFAVSAVICIIIPLIIFIPYIKKRSGGRRNGT